MLVPLQKDFKANNIMGLSVEKPLVPEFVRKVAQDKGLNEKETVHISVMVTKNARLLREALGSKSDAADLLALVESAFMDRAWEYALTNEYFLHERNYSRDELRDNGYEENIPEHTRRTIVQKVILPDLVSFYEEVNRASGISIPVPVPHITLFAWSDYEPFKIRGIGINSAEEFERFTKQVLKES